MDAAKGPMAPRGGVAVTILTDSDPIRLCHRLTAGLAGTPWALERALIAAEQVYPARPSTPGATTQVVECVLVRTDGRPAGPDDLPSCLEGLEVVGVCPAPAADGTTR